MKKRIIKKHAAFGEPEEMVSVLIADSWLSSNAEPARISTG